MIVLCRHGHTEDSKGICIGRTHRPLSPKGILQAKELADTLADFNFMQLYSSPAQRTLETLAPLTSSTRINARIVQALDEIHMGAWDGLPFTTIRENYPEEYTLRGKQLGRFKPPQGESFQEVAQRAAREIHTISHELQPALVMTHAGVIRSLLCHLSGHPLDDLFYFDIPHTSLTIIRPTPTLEVVATAISADKLHHFLSKEG